ncbi:MAG: NCS2 family permease [Bacteroidales bacterium]|nr:NCS2 family permease [Bacteroidales bacterium]
MLEKIFHLKEKNTSIRNEILGGLTTFMTMAYILAVNPQILGDAGMDRNAVFTATILSSVVAMIFMAVAANLPVALAPGMGLNAFFAYTVVTGMGYSWQTALTAVFIEGILFIIMSFFNIREAIINSIPANLKLAISVGIGLFIAFIGLKNAEIIIGDPSTLLKIGDTSDPGVLLSLAGIIITGALLVFRIKGALILGMLIVTLIGIPIGITQMPGGSLITAPPSLGPTFLAIDLSLLTHPDLIAVVFTFLFVDVFDTVGTLVGVCSKAELLDNKGRVPRVKQALLADAIGTITGALLGTSTVTSYIESASGISAGGRTGLTTLMVALLFLLALFLYPVFSMVPAVAIAPVLVIVGLFMISPIRHIDLEDYSEAIPVFLTIIIMPLTLSISEGIIVGMMSYVFLKVLTGRWKQVSLVMYILCAVFLLKFIL